MLSEFNPKLPRIQAISWSHTTWVLFSTPWQFVISPWLQTVVWSIGNVRQRDWILSESLEIFMVSCWVLVLVSFISPVLSIDCCSCTLQHTVAIKSFASLERKKLSSNIFLAINYFKINFFLFDLSKPRIIITKILVQLDHMILYNNMICWKTLMQIFWSF